MARKAREVSSTGVYAVIIKGAWDIFSEDEMKAAFYEAAEKYLGDGLMGIRLEGGRAEMLVCESEDGISKDMKPLMTSFARTYNRVHETSGRIYCDRFKSVPVEDDETEKACISYLEGGALAELYTAGRKPQTVKPERVKKSEPVKKKSEPVSTPEPEVKQEAAEAPKPKKKKDLPSWLL